MREHIQELRHETPDYGPLTLQQAENIADLAAARAEARIYNAIGRSVVRKGLFLVGAASAAFAAWLSGFFHLPLPPK